MGNDFDEEDNLYRNKGDGTFEDMTQHALPYTSWFSMGADTGDVNGDGLPDMFIADMAGSNHYLKKAFMGSMNTKAWFMDNAPHKQVMHNCLYINGGGGYLHRSLPDRESRGHQLVMGRPSRRPRWRRSRRHLRPGRNGAEF